MPWQERYSLIVWVKYATVASKIYRASGLTLVLAAIILWNTVYLGRAIDDLKAQGLPVDDNLLEHLSPSAGNTSISRVITSGARIGAWKAASSDLSDPFQFLSVRFCPFREVKRQ